MLTQLLVNMCPFAAKTLLKLIYSIFSDIKTQSTEPVDLSMNHNMVDNILL